MTRARDFADVISGNFDLPVGALDNVPIPNVRPKNLIMNGGFQVAQRGTTYTHSTPASSGNGFQTVDRWEFASSNTDEAVIVQSQSTEVPSGQGFTNSYKIEVTTAESSITSSEDAVFQTQIEGQDLQHLAFGTSSAKKLTLSFWVRSSLTGKYSILFYQNTGPNPKQSNTPSFTISAADTWEKKVITLDGDTGGNINVTTNPGLLIRWVLAHGYSGTPHTGWGDYLNGTDNAHGDQVNFILQTGTFYITGVQLEVGDTATDFEFVSYADELSRCQRYFQRVEGTVFPCSKVNGASSGSITATSTLLPIFNGVMRAEPTITGANMTLRSEAGGTTATPTDLVSNAHKQSLVTATHNSADTTGVTQFRSDYFNIDAEL